MTRRQSRGEGPSLGAGSHSEPLSPELRPTPGFRRGLLLTSSGTIVSVLFLFLESIVVARLLTPKSFGLYVIVLAVVSFLAIVVDFGLGTTVAKLISTSEGRRRVQVINNAMTFQLIVLAAVAALVWLFKGVLFVFDPTGTLVHYAVYVPPMLAVFSFDLLFQGILQGYRLYRHMAVAQIVRSVLRLGLTSTFLVFFHMGLTALIYSWITSFAVSSAYQFVVLPTSKRLSFDRSILSELLHFGLPLQLTSFLWFALRRIDILLLGTILGPPAVASFAVASRIPEGLQRLSDSYVTVYYPTVAALFGREKRARAAAMLNQSLRLVSFTAATAALVAVLFSHEIVTIIFSEKYASSSTTFGVLMLAFHIGFVVNLLGYTLTADGHPGRSFGASFARASLNIIADVVLIPTVGFIGPAFAQLISGHGTNPIVVWLLRRGDVDVKVAAYAKQTLLLLLGAVVYWTTQPTGLEVKLAFVAAFLLGNVALSTMTPEDWRMIVPTQAINSVHRRLIPEGPSNDV